MNVQNAVTLAGAACSIDRTFPSSADVRTSAPEAALTVA
jgi:hypothetical protein